MMHKSYVIIGDSFTFPDGEAATNRVYTYAKGFAENGIEVHIIGFRNDFTDTHFLNEGRITYYHPFARTRRSRSFIMRRYHKLRKYFNTIHIFVGIANDNEISQITVYSTSLTTHLFAWYLSRRFKASLVKECSEHPLRSHQNNYITRFFGLLKFKVETFFCDAVICISDYLLEFCREYGAANLALLKVPSTVDGNRFNGPFNRPFVNKYICYCGSLTKVKDGVDILIDSYAALAEKFPGIELLLVGRADTEEDERFFRDLVSNRNLNDRVFFTGKIQRNDIPAYLCNAEILVMARPKSIVADAGFPSKLSEYLATGRPVIATSVGEIPGYLTDNENVFLAEPGRIDQFAARMEYVLNNYEFACEVGRNGKEIALTIFNYNRQARQIISFIESLKD